MCWRRSCASHTDRRWRSRRRGPCPCSCSRSTCCCRSSRCRCSPRHCGVTRTGWRSSFGISNLRRTGTTFRSRERCTAPRPCRSLPYHPPRPFGRRSRCRRRRSGPTGRSSSTPRTRTAPRDAPEAQNETPATAHAPIVLDQEGNEFSSEPPENDGHSWLRSAHFEARLASCNQRINLRSAFKVADGNGPPRLSLRLA